MKNKISLIIILSLALSSGASVFADESNVVSDSKYIPKKEINDSLYDVNQYTNGFFTPHINKTVVDERVRPVDFVYTEDNIDTQLNQHGSLAPVKKLRLILHKQMILSKKNNTSFIKGLISKKDKKLQPVEQEDSNLKDQADMNCDSMEYFAARTELEANGHVVMVFPQNNSTIKADKMVYNQTTNLIKAYGNVVLINGDKEMHGDFMNVDLNEENAVMDKPVTDYFQVRAKAQKGYMYGDKIIQEQGNMLITKKTKIDIKSDFFGPNLDTMFVDAKNKSYFKKDSHGEKFKIKTDELLINSKKEHDTVTLKHATLFFGEKKLGTIPSITMHTNKSEDFVEANFPEIGTMTNMGLYAGPGFVFDTPKGTTLKVIPIINYQGNGDDTSNNSLGWGGIAKFKSATNKTDFGYGTANKSFLMRGYQKLDDDLFFQYASNSYMDDWFMGFRLPKLMGELVYQRDYPILDFFGKDKDFVFTHRATAGYMQDGGAQSPIFDSEGGVGTLRFKYMAEAAQTLYKWGDQMATPINARFEMVGQESSALYGTGDTQFVGRIGPRLHSQYENWMQDVGYFLSAYNDNTPMGFDRYMYGRSNVYLRESYRICKYLTMSWFGSLNLSNDSWDGKSLQENSFFFAIGPDDVKLNIGYDTVRQQSFVTMSMHLDAKGSDIQYKKMIIKNPDTLGKTNRGGGASDNAANAIFSPVASSSSDEASYAIEKAQVIDIPPNEAL